MDLLNLLSKEQLLGFSQNLSIARNYLGDRLFPDLKTRNIKAEFYRLSDPLQIPKMALVHALDTEARIGRRPTIERVEFEKMLIKEKINLSEKERLLRDQGVTSQQDLIDYIYNDMGQLSENVKTRTEVMKMEVLQSGLVTVTENNLDMTVDYGVPGENRVAVDWSDPEADVLGDIQNAVDVAKDKGQNITSAVTSAKIMNLLRKNKGIQILINGNAGVGTFISNTQIAALFNSTFGFTGIELNDDRYSYEQADGVITTKRYIDENKFILYAARPNNAVGTGLWGITPEEEELGPWTTDSVRQYITSIIWKSPDPLAVWTKASGMFIPVLPNPQGLVILTATLPSGKNGSSNTGSGPQQQGAAASSRTLNGEPFDLSTATASEIIEYAKEKGYTEVAEKSPTIGAAKLREMIEEIESGS